MNKGLKRLEWRFKNALEKQKPFIPNENDIVAYNEIETYYKNRRTPQFNANIHLVKLYIVVLGNRLKNANTSVFDKTIRDEILLIFRKPLNQIFDEFTKGLNESAIYELMEDLELNMKVHPVLVSAEERGAEMGRVVSGYENDERQRKVWKGNAWKRDDVEKNLRGEINGLFDYLEAIANN